MRGFREIHEIKESEKLYRDKKEEGYKKIKPEHDMTKEQAELYWQEIFCAIQES